MIEFFNKVITFFSQVSEFIYNGIYEFSTKAFAEFIIQSTIAYIEFKLFMIRFAWDTAKQIMAQLNISAVLNSAYSSLDGNVLGILTVLHVPDGINLILSAMVTKFVLRFMGM